MVAETNDREIVGAVLGGFDGRRGIMYHLAVGKMYRNRGVASNLVNELENRLIQKGCIKYYLLVSPENEDAIRFYKDRNWEKMNVLVYGKDLD